MMFCGAQCRASTLYLCMRFVELDSMIACATWIVFCWDIFVIMTVYDDEIFQVNGEHFRIYNLIVRWTRICRRDLIWLLGDGWFQ